MTRPEFKQLDRYHTKATRPAASEQSHLVFESLGGAEISTSFGATLELRQTFPWSECPAAHSFARIHKQGWSPGRVDPRTPDSVALNRVVFIDIETTGLSIGAGTVAFLIGLVWADPQGLQLQQFLMRDFSEEAAQQEALSAALARFETIVTYNGASFDIPVLKSRAIMNRISADSLCLPHVDLLHPVRAVWKRVWPDCKLQTAEQQLLGVLRTDDCEGWEVPIKYREFLTFQTESSLEHVLTHNAQDLVSLACLMALMERLFEPDHDGFGLTQEELFGLARALNARGRQTESTRLLQAGRLLGRLSPDYGRAMRSLVRDLKRTNQWNEARSLWSELQSSPDPFERYWGWIEEAKYSEHKLHDYELATVSSTEAARALAGLPETPTTLRARNRLFHRQERLKRRPIHG